MSVDVEGADGDDEDATAEAIAKTRSQIDEMFGRTGRKLIRDFKVFDSSPPTAMVSAVDIDALKVPTFHKDDSQRRTAEHTKTMVGSRRTCSSSPSRALDWPSKPERTALRSSVSLDE